VLIRVTTTSPSSQQQQPLLRSDKIEWNGGHPVSSRQTGSCWCTNYDGYCMCTPSIAIDLIIVSGPGAGDGTGGLTDTEEQKRHQKDHLWLVRRKDTDQLATMGGFVMVGETVEHAVKRELKEEMGIDLMAGTQASAKTEPTLFGVYSDPRRDNRRHSGAFYLLCVPANQWLILFLQYYVPRAHSSYPHTLHACSLLQYLWCTSCTWTVRKNPSPMTM